MSGKDAWRTTAYEHLLFLNNNKVWLLGGKNKEMRFAQY